MRFTTPAIVVALRPHGEHGAIIRLMTPEHGLQAAYVRGARGRHLRPVLVPGNLVRADFRARTEEQLPALTVELSESRAGMMSRNPTARSAATSVRSLVMRPPQTVVLRIGSKLLRPPASDISS